MLKIYEKEYMKKNDDIYVIILEKTERLRKFTRDQLQS